MQDEFADILNQTAQEYAQAEVFDSWMPPDGDYTAFIKEYKDGVKQEQNGKYGWMRLTGQLLEDTNAELNNREFSLAFCTTKAPGVLKGLCKQLTGGQIINDINQARQVLKDAVGKVVVISVRTKTNPKTNKEFTNCDILRVESGTEQASA
jgi:hypothetical protein